jgi:hypothetical protein
MFSLLYRTLGFMQIPDFFVPFLKLWCQKEEATVRTIIQQDAVGNPPAKRTQQRHVQLQERLQNLDGHVLPG